MKTKKLIPLSLSIVPVISLFSVIGCTQEESEEQPIIVDTTEKYASSEVVSGQATAWFNGFSYTGEIDYNNLKVYNTFSQGQTAATFKTSIVNWDKINKTFGVRVLISNVDSKLITTGGLLFSYNGTLLTTLSNFQIDFTSGKEIFEPENHDYVVSLHNHGGELLIPNFSYVGDISINDITIDTNIPKKPWETWQFDIKNWDPVNQTFSVWIKFENVLANDFVAGDIDVLYKGFSIVKHKKQFYISFVEELIVFDAPSINLIGELQDGSTLVKFEGFEYDGFDSPKDLVVNNTFSLEGAQFESYVGDYNIARKTFSVYVKVTNATEVDKLDGSFSFTLQGQEVFSSHETYSIHLYECKPIPSKAFEIATEGGQFVIKGINDGIDLSAYNTLQIPYFAYKIDDGAFKDVFKEDGAGSSIKYLDFGENPGLGRIGNHAFEGCTSFMYPIKFPDTLLMVGDYAFNGCTNLITNEKNFLPKKMFSIGEGAFKDCKSLTGNLNLTLIESLGKAAFSGCSGFDGELYLPTHLAESCYAIEEDCFRDCSNLKGNINLSYPITEIGDHAFAGCSSLDGEIQGFGHITKLGVGAFEGCTKLQGKIADATHLTEIPSYAFSGCESFEGEFDLNNFITIGMASFQNCKKMVGPIKLNENVTTIPNQCFAGCDMLTEIDIPKQIKIIGERSFENCKSLKLVNFNNNLETIQSYAFNDCKSLVDFIIPESCTEILECAFKDCTSLLKINIPKSVTTIGDNCFEGCTGANEIDLSAYDALPDWVIASSDIFKFDAETLGTVYVKEGTALLWDIPLHHQQALPTSWRILSK